MTTMNETNDMTQNLIIKDPEHMRAVKAFANDNGIADELDAVLTYVRDYGAMQTQVEVWPDKSFGNDYNMIAEIFVREDDEYVHWMTMGIIYNTTSRKWGTHT